MIHNVFLVLSPSAEILASVQYWPVEVSKSQIQEFIATQEELKKEQGGLEDLPLNIGESKFIGRHVTKDIVLVFVTDKDEDEQQVTTRVEEAAKTLQKAIVKIGLEKTITDFEQVIEPHIITRLKIALVGEGGTGKTTTLHLLLGDTPPLQYVPTIALNLETVENIRFGNYSLVLWDFAGQERFRTLWRFYFHGADVIILVCDSTLRNVLITKEILKMIHRDAPKVPIIAIANKQDKPKAMKPEVVQKILGVPTYPMVAIDKSRRDEMLKILMNAAAQYVGIALPDLPVSELLRFTEVKEPMRAEAGEVSEEEEEEEEEYEVVEEVVYVDEEGRPIENLEGYEIIEEEVTEIVEDETQPMESEASQAPTTEQSSSDTEEVESYEAGHIPERTEASGETTTDVSFNVPVETGAAQVEDTSVSVEVEDTEQIPRAETAEVGEVSESDAETTTAEEKAPETKMMVDIITEAIDADDMLAAEIEQVSEEDLMAALEAFSSDEVVPTENNGENTQEINEDTLAELDEILGDLCSDLEEVFDGLEEPNEDEESEADVLDEKALKELDMLFEGKTKKKKSKK